LGAGYQVETCNDINGNSWTGTSVSANMASLAQTYQIGPDNGTMAFYRTRRTQ
jgi:hypothetical protein